MPDQWTAMEVAYRFTRQDGALITPEQHQELNDSMFTLIGTWAAERALNVEGEALFEWPEDGAQ
ncbi:hypothetical protein GO986_08895 [Deinococcus sp. HMF7620]|uniref:Uncharacterized protein n=1 Tax=Deinococcus arboris TaxID=2682977 RepID=A0A7C9LTU9_9DEIO|nr:hypothetical protein [Deinococcus arboris]MVN86880.1 hypothetical protein [Deinococcus arboris]